jgi:hypothetical protein
VFSICCIDKWFVVVSIGAIKVELVKKYLFSSLIDGTMTGIYITVRQVDF